jgi:hypothetical protein
MADPNANPPFSLVHTSLTATPLAHLIARTAYHTLLDTRNLTYHPEPTINDYLVSVQGLTAWALAQQEWIARHRPPPQQQKQQEEAGAGAVAEEPEPEPEESEEPKPAETSNNIELFLHHRETDRNNHILQNRPLIDKSSKRWVRTRGWREERERKRLQRQEKQWEM